MISLQATNDSTVWQVAVTDLNRQVLETAKDLQARHDKQLETILKSLNPRFDSLEKKLDDVEKDLGAKIEKVEKDLGKVDKDVTFIRAAGTVAGILVTLAFKIPSSVWDKVFSVGP